MIGVDDARRVLDVGNLHLIAPEADWWDPGAWSDAGMVAKGFRYASDANTDWMDQLRKLAVG